MKYSIDASMNSSVVCKWTDDYELKEIFFFTSRKKDIDWEFENITNIIYVSKNYFHEKKTFDNGLDKNLFMINSIVEYIKNQEEEITEIGIEGNSFNSIGKTSDVFQYTGALKYALMKEFDIKLHEYPPTVIKKYAGKGNYDKEAMRDAMRNKHKNFQLTLDLDFFDDRFGKDKHPQEDIVDAFWIGKLMESLDIRENK